PTCSVLYKTCPPRPSEWDVITLFVQPLAEDLCDVWPWMALFDDETSITDLIHFQQPRDLVFEDRAILQEDRLLEVD
ncbi:aromatic ring-hydroxylating dioxygenase subunit alpha, partial [Rhizobium ruizarguesonis]